LRYLKYNYLIDGWADAKKKIIDAFMTISEAAIRGMGFVVGQ